MPLVNEFSLDDLMVVEREDGATAFGEYGRQPSLKMMQKLAASAGFGSWKEAQQGVHEAVEEVSGFVGLAKARRVKN